MVSDLVARRFWIERIGKAWQRRSVVWLSGVRRVGKTCLCLTLGDIEYFDCELPRVRRMLEDPESFWEGMHGKRVVLDEVHRLPNPSEVLKIAADHFPGVKILATGSSTLGASARFKDTLSGRKAEVWLTPMILSDLKDFGQADLKYRLLRGGLPPFFLSGEYPEQDFQEWMDAFWAKDIQELFRLGKRYSFLRFVELLLMQSGGIFEATRFAGPCEASRTTIANYLEVLQSAHVAHVLRPFSTYRSSEIISAPKVYAFDTGFVCYYRGLSTLRPDDLGLLWEHLVLNEIQACFQMHHVHYWRDKRGHEVDFVLIFRGISPIAIECKWSANDLDCKNLLAFSRRYPEAVFFVVAADVKQAFSRKYKGISIKFLNLPQLIEELDDRRPQGVPGQYVS